MIATLIALILLMFMVVLIRKRHFFAGIAFGLMTLTASFIAFLQLLIKIADQGETAEVLVLLCVYGLIPLIFIVFCSWLVYNSTIMRTREGKSFTAKLSLLLGLNIIIVIPLFFFIVSGFFILPGRITFFLSVFICLVDMVFTFTFIGYLFCSFLYQAIPVRKTVNYIIILGAGVSSEEVTPLLRSRLDKAIEYQGKQTEKIIFVVSGGQGDDEPVSEAFAMRKYLLSKGIPNEQIIFEDKSTTTLENMLFSNEKIKEHWNNENEEPVILFSTSNYHVLRGAMYARKANIKAEGIGAPVALYFLPTALIREFIALLVKYKVLTIAIVIIIFVLLLLTNLQTNKLFSFLNVTTM